MSDLVDAPAVGPDGVAPDARRARDLELAADGWRRRFTAAPPRLGEARSLYEATGQEVLMDDVLPGELVRECAGCTLALAVFKVVYTRPRAAEGSSR